MSYVLTFALELKHTLFKIFLATNQIISSLFSFWKTHHCFVNLGNILYDFREFYNYPKLLSP